MIRNAVAILAFASVGLAADAFDVASIKPSQGGRETVDVVPGSVTMRNMRLTGAIRWAYNVLDVQVSNIGFISRGGPGSTARNFPSSLSSIPTAEPFGFGSTSDPSIT